MYSKKTLCAPRGLGVMIGDLEEEVKRIPLRRSREDPLQSWRLFGKMGPAPDKGKQLVPHQSESVLLYCQYHKSHTHAMDDCMAVKRLIEESLARRNQEKRSQPWPLGFDALRVSRASPDDNLRVPPGPKSSRLSSSLRPEGRPTRASR